ncbi:MAG: hypothetical protein JRJ00_13670, partial [Deltaproteobacteria bacterium]|nr:hypothetical protein [Deltaproteobacteria bacterium]
MGVIFLAGAASGNDWYVDGDYTGETQNGDSWSTPYTEIGDALGDENITADDTIWIKANTYNELIAPTIPLKFKSRNYAWDDDAHDEVIIDGEDSG